MSRKIEDCVEALQKAWAYASKAWNDKNEQKVILTQTYRSNDEQEAYYAQGRKSLHEVNRLRSKANLPAIKAEENIVITFKKAGTSKHNLYPSQAFDVGFVDAKGKLDWSHGNFDKFAKLLREKFPNVVWGADWDKDGQTKDEKFVDRPHFQV